MFRPQLQVVIAWHWPGQSLLPRLLPRKPLRERLAKCEGCDVFCFFFVFVFVLFCCCCCCCCLFLSNINEKIIDVRFVFDKRLAFLIPCMVFISGIWSLK